MVELDWANLSFKARPTNALVVSYYRNGQWSVPEVTSNFNLTLSSFAGVFHYASACIEGLKAFRGIDSKVRIFRPGESGERLRSYNQVLFLDPKTKTKIDEFASSNFFAIKGNEYITPLSDTILPSITNNSLQHLAEDMGYKVVIRPIPVEDLAEFEEVNTCGTAIVLRPVHRIDDRPTIESEILTKSYTFGAPDKCGAVSQKLYNFIRDIQEGREEDIHNWCLTVR